MAYDKVVDSAALDAVFTDIANAVRKNLPPLENTVFSHDLLAEAVNSIADYIRECEVRPAEEAGRSAQWNAFWDAYQENGKRTNYSYGFYGNGWNDVSFQPKYDLIVKNCTQMFYNANITELSAILSGLGVTLDTSNVTEVTRMFGWSIATTVPTLDFRNVSKLNEVFYQAKNLHTVEHIQLKTDGSQTFPNTFYNTLALENIYFSGVIGNDISFAESLKLSADSMTNMIVYNLSSTAVGKTLTLNKAAVDTAFETRTGAADGSTSAAWLEIFGLKPNWTINLV